LAESWCYRYTDFGEGRGRFPQPILRAVIGVAAPGAPTHFAAIIDTGGPITVVARAVLHSGGDPVDRKETLALRLAGAVSAAALYDLTLEVRPPVRNLPDTPVRWRSVVAVLDPWPHAGTAVILGQSGFLDTFTVTFGPEGFALEPGAAFQRRFPI
jgi:hypothetical protein